MQQGRMRAALKKRKRRRNYTIRKYVRRKYFGGSRAHVIKMPSDSRVIENVEKCLLFLKELRQSTNYFSVKNRKILIISMADITQIDYGMLCILEAISDDLKKQHVIFQGNLPKDKICKKFIEDSGFLNYMVDKNNQPFRKTSQSSMIFFTKGKQTFDKISRKEISRITEKTAEHLIGKTKKLPNIYSILLEICGNSIEWSGKRWLLGVQYENGKVVFTVTDVGYGILHTLHRTWGKVLFDKIAKSNSDILYGAFKQKYGSKTEEINRNKGLPSVKTNFDDGKIKNLIVLTNNVILHFEDESLTESFVHVNFKGTYYQWEITKTCIENGD